MSTQAVYRLEQKMEKREDVQAYLRQKAVPPRDPDRRKVRTVTKRKKSG